MTISYGSVAPSPSPGSVVQLLHKDDNVMIPQSEAEPDDADFFADAALDLFGSEGLIVCPEEVVYGPVVSRIPEKEGKAHIVLADQIFNSGLVMAELVELDRAEVAGQHILELGASTSLPTLLAATLNNPPSSILTTDYPDENIIRNLRRNIERNGEVLRCPVSAQGYKWGEDTAPLRAALPAAQPLFTLIIASDLLWLSDEHASLLRTISSTLAPGGTAWFTCGHYTKRPIAERFFSMARERGFASEEVQLASDWEGRMEVDLGRGKGEDGRRELGERKRAVWCFRMWWRDAPPAALSDHEAR